MADAPFFDLASLTKPLVTAPLALRHLDLETDRRAQLGFHRRPTPLTVRQLLCHTAGLPPWLPYTGEPLAQQLERGFPEGAHPLLKPGREGVSVYSDLGYRLLAELLELESGRTWRALGAEATGLSFAPYPLAPEGLPDAQDAVAWRLAEPTLPVPPQAPRLPHDANARAGMPGHAGFGGTPQQVQVALERWLQDGWPAQMAHLAAHAEDGLAWGLGLHRLPVPWGTLLSQIPGDCHGVHVCHQCSDAIPVEPLPQGQSGEPAFWGHFGFTGGALFVRPATSFCLCLLTHRRGPGGQLLDLPHLQARRWAMLKAWCQRHVS